MGSQEIASTRFIADSTAYYKLEDVNDSVGTNHLTNANTVTFTAGKFGNAANFVGTSSQALYVSNATAWKQTGNFSVSFWAKTSSDEQYLAQASAYDGQAAGWFIYQTGTKLRFYICNHAGTNPYVETTAAINDGNWHYYVCLWNGTQMIIYKDGQLACTPTSSTTAPVYISTYCELGCRNNSGSRDVFYTGSLDDFDILNRALTPDEIYSLYKTGVKKLNGVSNIQTITANAGLVHYYTMEGNSNDNKGAINGSDTSITYGVDYGKFGQGASFNGSSSKISFASMDALSTFSVSLWVKYDAIGSMVSVFDKSFNGTSGFRIWTGTTWNAILLSVGSTNWSVGSAQSTGTWLHYVLTYTGGTALFYINGSLIDTKTGLSLSDTSSTLMLGADYAGDSDWFDGSIDDVSIYSAVLTSTEISNLYNTNIKKYMGISNV